MSKNVPSNHEPPISPADWDAIVAAAFSPDAEPHVFSDHYQKQKQKLGGITYAEKIHSW